MSTDAKRPVLRQADTSFGDTQYFDAVDGTVKFDVYDVLPDTHRFVPFENNATVLVVTEDPTTYTAYWMDMATQNPTSEFVVLSTAEPRGPISKPSNVRIEHEGRLKSFASNTFDFCHLQRVVSQSDWPRCVKELVRVTKSGGCIQMVQFELKTGPKSPAPIKAFSEKHGVSQLLQQLVSHHGLHLVQENLNSYDLYAAQKDAVAYKLLLELISNIVNLETEDEKERQEIMDALRPGPHQVQLQSVAVLAEKLAY